MATIVLIICLIILGTLFSFAFLRFFQGKKKEAAVWFVIFIVSMIVFYWAMLTGVLALPKQY